MIRFYFNLAPNPAKVALMLEELGLPYRSRSRRYRQGRAARARLSRHQSERQGAGDRRHRGAGRARGAGVRFERDPALSRRKGRPLHRLSRRSAGTPVVAVLHRLGARSLLRPGGAFPARGAGKDPLRREPLSARDRAALSRPRQASGRPRLHRWPGLLDRRHVGLGLARRAPRSCCRARTILSPPSQISSAWSRRSTRARRRRGRRRSARIIRSRKRWTRTRSARCSRRTIQRSRCELEAERSGVTETPPGPVGLRVAVEHDLIRPFVRRLPLLGRRAPSRQGLARRSIPSPETGSCAADRRRSS